MWSEQRPVQHSICFLCCLFIIRFIELCEILKLISVSYHLFVRDPKISLCCLLSVENKRNRFQIASRANQLQRRSRTVLNIFFLFTFPFYVLQRFIDFYTVLFFLPLFLNNSFMDSIRNSRFLHVFLKGAIYEGNLSIANGIYY